MQYTKTVTLDINGSEIHAELKFEYTPEIPGVYTALPENSYPTEPEEFDLLSLKTEDGDNCDWMIPFIAEDLVSQLKEGEDSL
jgi:hypothetical protein